MDNGAVVVDRQARQALAAWLLDNKFERPQTIPKQIWRGLICAELACLDFKLLGEICDTLGSTVLEVIRWPDARNWDFPQQPINGK
jgi:hypothetical protein